MMTAQEKKVLEDAQRQVETVKQLLLQKINEKAVKTLLEEVNEKFIDNLSVLSGDLKATISVLQKIAENSGIDKKAILDAIKEIKLKPKIDIKTPKAEVDVKIPEIKVPRPKVKVSVKVPEVKVNIPPIKVPKAVVSIPKQGIKTLGFANFAKSVLSALKSVFNANMFVYGKHISSENPVPVLLVDKKGNPYMAMGGGGGIVVGGKSGDVDRIVARKSINVAAEDINAAAYSQTTAHQEDYGLTGIFLKFSTAVSKTITLSITDGTTTIPFKIWSSDTATSRVFLPDKNWKLPKDWEIKVDITKTTSACLADILLITH